MSMAEPGFDFSTEDLAVPSEELFVSDSAVDPVTTRTNAGSWNHHGIIIFHHGSSLTSAHLIEIIAGTSPNSCFLGPGEKHAAFWGQAPSDTEKSENFSSSSKISSSNI